MTTEWVSKYPEFTSTGVLINDARRPAAADKHSTRTGCVAQQRAALNSIGDQQ